MKDLPLFSDRFFTLLIYLLHSDCLRKCTLYEFPSSLAACEVMNVGITYMLVKSFTRRRLRHFAFFIIIVCIMMIPLFQSIFISSEIEGQKLYIQTTTKGAAFRLTNANEEDLLYFDSMENLSAIYDEGSIWFFFDESSSLPSNTIVDETGRYLQNIVEDAGFDQSSLTNIYYIGKDESFIHSYDKQKFLGYVFLCLSMVFMLLSCNSHMRLFINDISQLRSIGATKQHIRLLFLVEYLFISLCAGICAVGLSLAVMRALYSLYLETRSQILAWNVFHIDIIQLALPVLFLVIGGFVFVYWRAGVIAAFSSTRNWKKKERRKIKFLHRSCQPASYLASIFIKYNNKSLVECSLISLMVIVLMAFVVNSVNINYSYVSERPIYDILISTPSFDDGVDIDMITEISELPDTETVNIEPLIRPTDFVILDDRLTEVSDYRWDDIGCALTWIHNATAYPDISEQLDENQVIVTGNYQYLDYNVGDTILLQATAGQYDYSSVLQLYVASVVDIPGNDIAVDLFFSDTLYSKITQNLPIGEIHIKLKNPSTSSLFAYTLREMYPNFRDCIIDFYTPYLESVSVLTGQAIMYSVILLLVLLCICIIIFVKISEYLQENQRIHNVLVNIGASSEMLKKAYFLQAIMMFFLSSVSALILAYSFLYISLDRAGNQALFSWGSVVIQFVLCSLIALAYFLPVVLFSINTQQRRKTI